MFFIEIVPSIIWCYRLALDDLFIQQDNYQVEFW